MSVLAPPLPRRPPRPSEAPWLDVVVVGGGISGLSAAFALARAGLSFRLLEAGHRFGGVIRTEHAEGFLLETGPDNLLAQKPAWRALCEALGISHRLIPANPERNAVWLLRRDRLLRFPAGMALAVPTRPAAFLRSPLFSWTGKARMALEPFAPAASEDDESVAAFLRRRLGPQAVERIGQPLLAGIHAADAERLSLRSTFPTLADMETRHGSLLRAAWAARRRPSPAGPAFYSLSGGLTDLVTALAAALPPGSASLGTPVRRLERDDGGWRVHARGGAVRARAVVLAVPPAAAAALLVCHSTAAAPLAALRSASSAVVLLGFRRADVAHPLDGHGLLAVREPMRHVAACSFVSTKFPGRAPEGHVLLRAFVGGATDERLLESTDEGIVDHTLRALDPVLGFRRWPVLERVYRWPAAMPQMNVGHATRVADIEAGLAETPGLFLASAGVRGVGVPDCIAEGQGAAALAATHVRARVGAA